MVTTINAESSKERVAEERRLDRERAQLQLQWHRKSAAIAEQNGTVARPLVELEEATAATEAHLKQHSAYSSISLVQKPKGFRMGFSSQTGAGVNAGAFLNTRADEEETQPRLKYGSEQGNNGDEGQGDKGEEEVEDEEEKVERSPAAFSSGPSPWLAPPSNPSRTVRMKSVRMSRPQGRTATSTREKFGQGSAELDESDSSSGSGSEEGKGQQRGQARKISMPGWFKVGIALPGGSEDEDEERFAEERRAASARSQAADAAREHLRRSSTNSYMSASINTRPVGGRSMGRRESAVHDVPDQHKLLSRLEQRFSVPSSRSGPHTTSQLEHIEGAPTSTRGSESTAFSAHPSMRMPNVKSAGHLQSYLLSPSGSLTRSTASTTASSATHAEVPTTRRRQSSPVRQPRQASVGGALYSPHSSFAGLIDPAPTFPLGQPDKSPKGPFSPVPPASEPSHAPPRGGRHTIPAQWAVGLSTPHMHVSPPTSSEDPRAPVLAAQRSQSQGKLTPRHSMLESRSRTLPSVHGLEGLPGSHPSSLHNLSTAHLAPKVSKPAAARSPPENTILIGDEPLPKSGGESDRSGVLGKLTLPTQGDQTVGSASDSMGTDSWPGFVHSKSGSHDGHPKGCLAPGVEASAITLEDGPRHETDSGCETSHSSFPGPTGLSVNSSSRASPAELLQHAPYLSDSLTGRGHRGFTSPHHSPDKLGHAHSGVALSHSQLELRSSLLGSDRLSKQLLSDSRLSGPIPKFSVADPRESLLNRPNNIVSDDGTQQAGPEQEALKPPHPVCTRPASALKSRNYSASPHAPGNAPSAGASKHVSVSLDAPRVSVPNSSGSSPHTPSSPSTQEPQVQPSPQSNSNYGPGGPIRIQSSRSIARKPKTTDEGLSGSFDLAQQQPSPKAGLAGLAIGGARRRSALQASKAPLKATPHSLLTEPMARSSDFHKGSVPDMGAARQLPKPGTRSSVDEKAKPQPPPSLASKQRSSSEPRQQSKLRKNSTSEGSGSRPSASGAPGDTKRAPEHGKSILNIKAALGSAMASVLNPVMPTQRK